jgi:hypothetical protein
VAAGGASLSDARVTAVTKAVDVEGDDPTLKSRRGGCLIFDIEVPMSEGRDTSPCT